MASASTGEPDLVAQARAAEARVEDRRGRMRPGDGRERLGVRGPALDAREEDGVRAAHRIQRLAKASPRGSASAAEGIAGVEEEEVDVAGHGQMLEPVVEHEEIRAEVGRPPGGLDASLADDHDDSRGRSRQRDGLVAAALGGDQRALARRDDDDAARGAAVAAGEDRGPPALETEPPREKLDEGSLAGAPERQVADRDRRPRQGVRNDAARGVPARPQLQRFAVEPGEGG